MAVQGKQNLVFKGVWHSSWKL